MTDEPSSAQRIDLEELGVRALSTQGPLHVVEARGLGPSLLGATLADLIRSGPSPRGAAGAQGASSPADPRPQRRMVVLVAESGERAAALEADLRALLPDSTVLALPEFEGTPYDHLRSDRRTSLTRTAALDALRRGRVDVLCVPASLLLRRFLAPATLANYELELAVGQVLELDALSRTLDALGYERTPLVEDEGGFSVRGSLLDLWPAGQPAPLRVELDFDAIVSIQSFDPETQARHGADAAPLERLEVPLASAFPSSPAALTSAKAKVQELADQLGLPTREARKVLDALSFGGHSWNVESLLPAFDELVPLHAYLGDNPALVLEDVENLVGLLRGELERAQEAELREPRSLQFPVRAHYLALEELGELLGSRGVTLCLHRAPVFGSPTRALEELEFVQAPWSVALDDQSQLSAALAASREKRSQSSPLRPLLDYLATAQESGETVLFTARSASQAERLETLLSHRGLRLSRIVAPPVRSGQCELPRGALALWVAPLSSGVVWEQQRFAIITEEEIFGARRHVAARKNRAKIKATLDDLKSLEPGDFVIHVEHGIGRYLGLEHKQVGSNLVDFFVVEYSGGDKLFVPVYRLNQIQKHAGGDARPKLDRLGGQSFEKTKARARRRAYEMADQLLRLYAERVNVVREPLPPPDDEYRAFEAEVPFDETPDQADAIADVLADLQKPKVMDRLVSGDVGFGKTEVALRAAYLMALAGRQTALLCPTTVLAEQHARTFEARLGHLGISVRSLSRFTGQKEQTQTLLGLKNGHVDVVVGTHRLLSSDVHFKNLGLLVIDEEQRFGVAHKERMKDLRKNVDVLTLSATPIPRTLSLAIGGLRDMSVISTPPETRRAIRTFVASREAELVATAIERELKRGGQIYYVVNRIEELYARANELKELVPGLRLRVAHGQMNDRELEKTMLAFVDGEADLLAATTIIESGLDIPRANTIFIERADTFGLAQLYQIRGRVGRSSERAYCYLLVPPPSELTREATLRLEALTKHTELGAGFQIATLDMELRGAGDLLGKEQSGVLESVGFELFSEMLENAARELSGQEVVKDIDPELSVDVEALLPETYIEDIGVRLSLYKRMAGAPDEGEMDRLAAEMEDRFGTPPSPALALIELMRLKVELRRLRGLGMNATQSTATLHLRSDTPLQPELLVPFLTQSKGLYSLSPDGRLTRRAAKHEVVPSGLVHADRMLSELSALLNRQ